MRELGFGAHLQEGLHDADLPAEGCCVQRSGACVQLRLRAAPLVHRPHLQRRVMLRDCRVA